MNGFKASLSCVTVQDDVFQDHDRIIDNQADRGRQTAKGHEVEALTSKLQDDESDEQGGRNHEPGDKGRAPVTQKENEDDGREQ